MSFHRDTIDSDTILSRCKVLSRDISYYLGLVRVQGSGFRVQVQGSGFRVRVRVRVRIRVRVQG
jgi:hypothetical protein